MAIIGNYFKIKDLFFQNKLNIVFDYLNDAIISNNSTHLRIKNLPVGAFEKFDLSNGIFALEQVFYSKDRTDCFIESHKKYVDFQLIISGVEQMEYLDIDKAVIENSYNEGKDLITYKLVDNTSKFVMESNDLAIFFPEDAHIGMPEYKKSCKIYKTVVKVPISFFEVNGKFHI